MNELKPLALKPRYALDDEPCPVGSLEIRTPAGRLLIPVEHFRGALDWIGDATPPDAVPAPVAFLDIARRMVAADPRLRALPEDFDTDDRGHLAAAIVADADPPGVAVIGREAADTEPVPQGYAEARTDTGRRLFLLIASKPFTFRGVVAGDLPVPTVRFADVDPVEHDGRTYRYLLGFAMPSTPPTQYTHDFEQVRAMVQLGAPTLGQQAAAGFYPTTDDECPDGFVEVTDAEGTRAFLNAEIVDAVRAGREFTGVGPSMLDRFGGAMVTEATNDAAAALEAQGIQTDNSSAEALAARADHDELEHVAQVLAELRAEGHTTAGARDVLDALAATRDELVAARLALSTITSGDPVPPDCVHTSPWGLDMLDSLKRARAERDAAVGVLDAVYRERNRALAAVALMGEKCGLVRARVAEGADPDAPDWPLLYLDIPTMRPGPPKPERVGFHFSPADAGQLEGIERDPSAVPESWSKEADDAAMDSFLAWLRYKPSGPVLFVTSGTAHHPQG